MSEKCGARTKSKGTPCKKPAGWGTKHVGEGKCKLHGGASDGRPLIHGRYSLKHRQSLNDKVNKFLQDPEPGNLLAELAVLRALLQDYMDRFEEGLPLPLKSMFHIQDFIEGIGRTVERISRILNATALTQAEIHFLRARIIDLIDKYIEDDQKRLEFINALRYAIEGDRKSDTGELSAQTADITINEVVDVSE